MSIGNTISAIHLKSVFITVYFVFTLFVGYRSWRKVKDGRDFYVAGKKAGVAQVSGSLLATMLGSSAIIGSVDSAYRIGWAGSWFMLSAALGLVVLFFLVRCLKDYQGYNLPGLLGGFYGDGVKKLSSLIISIAWIGVVAAQIMGAAKILTVLLGISFATGVVITGTVFTLYTLCGGQLSVLKTDFWQLLFILAGLVLTWAFIRTTPVTTPAPGFFNAKFTGLDLLILFLTYSSTYFVGPDVYSRLFCAKDEKTMKRAIVICIAVLVPLGLMFGKIGIYATQAFSQGAIGKESVLFMIASQKLPGFVAFGLYVGLLSAVISSADTTLITAASLIAQVFTDDLDSRRGISATRAFMAVIGAASMVIAIHRQDILPTLLLAFTVYSGALIIPTLAGMLGLRPSKKVVMAAILTGGVVALCGKLYGGTRGNYVMILAFLLNGGILLAGKKSTLFFNE
ncbi:MAG: sodium:solute symporter family protein [Fusobacteriaceae bacterium]|jgi:SSS family solute:Na+ symporter|nr:sodium:solute symporter family protein [Fusobacteriaceae bacterium]